MSFLKKLFRKKTPEELKAELNALVEAQKRDNEMIKEWFRKPTPEDQATFREAMEEWDRIFDPINSYDAANMWNGLDDPWNKYY